MRGMIGAWIVCAGLGWSGAARAAPACDAMKAGKWRGSIKWAQALEESGDAEGALQVASRGLEAAPADLDLLRLQGKVLIELDRLPEALAAFQAFLRAGATGKEAQDARTVVRDLTPVLSTF